MSPYYLFGDALEKKKYNEVEAEDTKQMEYGMHIWTEQ